MSQLLALEWNDREARAAVASRHGDRIVIEQAFSIPLRPPEAERPEQSVGRQIAEALAARSIGPLDVLVAVGRGSVELRQLQLPAAPDDELPGLVRFRAMLEFNELDEKWPLDFVTIDDADKSHQNVLAAAIAPASSGQIEAVCQQSGLRIQRVLLRSCEAAAILARARIAQPGQVQLLIELFSDQTDLTAVVDGRVLLPRTVRLSGDVSHSVAFQSLLTEIRLTMAAVQNQFGGRQIANITLCGRGETDAALARRIEEAIGTSTALLDPFAGLEAGPQLRDSSPEQPGRFAAVLGMLLTECEQAGHAIDFLHTRHAVVPADPRRKWGFVAAAVAVLVLAYLVYGRVAYWRLDSEVHLLDAQSAKAQRILDAAGDRDLATADEIADWTDSEVVWLDRLRELSEDFPPADSATLGHLLLTRQSDRSRVPRTAVRPSVGAKMPGRILLEGWARDNKAIADLEQSLRAHARRMERSNTNEDRSLPPYSVKFRTTVMVDQESKP